MGEHGDSLHHAGCGGAGLALSASAIEARREADIVLADLPLLYLAYSVIRGAIVGFYAYPFLNPDKVGGYGGVVFYSVSIIAVFLFVSWVLLTLGNKLKRNVA